MAEKLREARKGGEKGGHALVEELTVIARVRTELTPSRSSGVIPSCAQHHVMRILRSDKGGICHVHAIPSRDRQDQPSRGDQ